MRLLLDTHLLLWGADEFERISAAAREVMAHPGNELLFSVASIWEIAIKSSQRRADFAVNPSVFRSNLLNSGYAELAITGEHAVAVEALPAIHRDPFDRILVAQAMVEGVPLLTMDAVVARYPGPVRYMG